jgi:hypothetical protein
MLLLNKGEQSSATSQPSPACLSQVSVCPFNVITGYTLFVEDENRTADAILTRSDMEAHMVRAIQHSTAQYNPMY